jgi:hypothetical protein
MSGFGGIDSHPSLLTELPAASLLVGDEMPRESRKSAVVCFAILAITILILAFVFLLRVRHTSSRPASETPVHQKD